MDVVAVPNVVFAPAEGDGPTTTTVHLTNMTHLRFALKILGNAQFLSVNNPYRFLEPYGTATVNVICKHPSPAEEHLLPTAGLRVLRRVIDQTVQGSPRNAWTPHGYDGLFTQIVVQQQQVVFGSVDETVPEFEDVGQ